MTTLNDYWPFLEAMKVGKTVQCQRNIDGPWEDLNPLAWSSLHLYSHNAYRIKAETKRVPLTAEDLPGPCWIRSAGSAKAKLVTGITAQQGVATQWKTYSFPKLESEGWEYAPSHKGPWSPCWKEE